MKLSTVFELLLIFLIIAFAASKFVDPKGGTKWKSLVEKGAKTPRKDRQASPNRYCSCSNLTCNCCRDFSLPVVPVSGPGCASLKYVQGDSMLVTMSFGDRILRNVTISGKKPQPICMQLPGGISKFCGRIYGISQDGDQIRACLGLELRALDDVEAALRVSCFKFGPKGLNIEPGKPVPVDEDEDDDDDDDDDDFDLPGDDDDDDDDDDNDDDDDVFGLDDDDDNDSENTVESGETDYTGFSALGDEFLDSFFESDSSKKKKKPNAIEGVPIDYKPQQIVTSKPIVPTTVPSKKVKPPRVVTTKLVISTPMKPIVTEKPVTPPTLSTDKVYVSPPSDRIYVTPSEKYSIYSDKFTAAPDKVYVSPSQYKPTEHFRPQPVKQTLESYVPTVPQLSTEKVYTSPQQISTDKIYVSMVNQQTTENIVSTMDDKEQPTINYYIPTTQQFQSTEKVYIPVNLSTPDSNDFEPVTSTLVSFSVVQGDDNKSINTSTPESVPQVSTSENSSTTEAAPDNEYNEVDSDLKTTINDRIVEVNTVSSTIGLKIRPTTKPTKDDDDGDEFEDVVDTAASVFGVDDESKKNDTSSEEIDLDDDLEDSDEDLEENSSSNIVLNSDSANNNDYNSEDDDDDDEFRKFDLHSKQTITLSSTSSSVAPIKTGRTHKRMNLPPLFSQKPEVSSLLNSGGHLYKIRMSPVQEVHHNPSRLGKLNLFVPAMNTAPNPLNIFNTHVIQSNNDQNKFNVERDQYRSSRNHKRMRLPPLEESTDKIQLQ